MGKYKSIIFYLILFLFIFALCAGYTNYDFDLWARLIAGMGVIDGGHVLKNDFLSYTPTHTWWDHEWGSGVIFYLVLKFLGPYWLVILHALLFFGIFFVISKIIKLRGAPPYNIIIYILAVLALSSNFNLPVRCHMFSFLLFTIFIYMLELVRKGSTKPLYLIPPLVIIWNNIHGGVVSGLGLIGMYAAGEFLNKKPYKNYLITLAVSSLALIINPWGFDYLKFLFMANSMQRPEVAEWWSPFSKFHMHRVLFFKFFMLASISTEAITLIKNACSDWYEKLDKVKVIILLSTLCLAITHLKLLPFFVIASMCFVYEDFEKLVKNINIPSYTTKTVYIMLFAVSLLTIAAREISVPLNFNSYPVREVEFVKINKIKGNLLVNFGLGSYAAYKLYPQNLIFMDGRYEEVYNDNMVPLLKKFFLVNEGWDEILVKYPPDVMILENYYPVYNVIKNSKIWTLVFEDKNFGVFVPTTAAKKHYIMPPNDIKYYKNNIFKTDIKF